MAFKPSFIGYLNAFVYLVHQKLVFETDYFLARFFFSIYFYPGFYRLNDLNKRQSNDQVNKLVSILKSRSILQRVDMGRMSNCTIEVNCTINKIKSTHNIVQGYFIS